VRLFVERAAATSAAFTFGDDEAPLVADICRRLDGVALAIELAAARVDAFGVHGLAARLRDPLQLLTGGRRPALPRHQTLRATLDWSHDLLSEPERRVLRRLAIFAAGFTLEAASAVAASAEITADEVVLHVANLVKKSLITADVGGAAPRYRLLGTTRAYALEKLFDSARSTRSAAAMPPISAIPSSNRKPEAPRHSSPSGSRPAAVGSMTPARCRTGSVRDQTRAERRSLPPRCPADGKGAGAWLANRLDGVLVTRLDVLDLTSIDILPLVTARRETSEQEYAG
jgi:hypothetical protein